MTPTEVTPNFKQPKKKRHRGLYGSGAKGEATRLHSLIVRARGVCESCGEREYSKLQCAHVITRKYANTRVDENAAFCLCARCHRRYTDWPLEWAEFVVAKLGLEGYDAIKRKAESKSKVDWDAEVLRLRELWKQVAA